MLFLNHQMLLSKTTLWTWSFCQFIKKLPQEHRKELKISSVRRTNRSLNISARCSKHLWYNCMFNGHFHGFNCVQYSSCSKWPLYTSRGKVMNYLMHEQMKPFIHLKDLRAALHSLGEEPQGGSRPDLKASPDRGPLPLITITHTQEPLRQK